jgi:hypothetical protein
MSAPAPSGGSDAFALALAEESSLRGSSGRPAPYPAPLAESGGESALPKACLPGSGEIGKGCGEWVVTHVCWPCAEGRVSPHQCDRRDCPECAGECPGGSDCLAGLPAHGGGGWAHTEARKAADRFEDFLEQHQLGRLPLRQVILSVPPDRFSEQGDHARTIAWLRRTAERAVRLYAWRNLYFGSAVVHLWRCDPETREQDYTRWGPHVHVVCPGVDVHKSTRYASRYGVVVVQANGSGGGWASYRGFGLYRHLVYELGHAAILADCHALSWFGALKTWRQPDPPIGKEEPVLCSAGHEMELWSWRWSLVEPLRPGVRTVHVDVGDGAIVELKLLGGPPEEESWMPPWGSRPACVRCHASWKPGDGELRCPHLGNGGGPPDG